MNTRHIRFFTALVLAASAARSAYAADSRWGVSVFGGDTVAESGELRAPLSVPLDNLGTFDPAFAGADGTLSLDRLRYEDLFRRRFDTGLELNYSFDDHLQTYGRFSYDSLGGRDRTIGTVEAAGAEAGLPLRARFGDQDNKSLQLGTRYLWSTGTAWSPYTNVSLGATRLDATRASLLVPDTGAVEGVQFTRPGTVFSQSVGTGVEYNPTPEMGVRFGIDAEHLGTPPSAHDPALASLGYDSAHEAQSRWEFPVSVAASYRFD